MVEDVKIAVVGVGLIGRSHVNSIELSKGSTLASIVDPSDEGRCYAEHIGVNWHPSVEEMFVQSKPDGVILATPNQHHLSGALTCIESHCPTLVEKPLCVTVADAQALVTAANFANIPVLTGHHRRHGDLLKKTKSIIENNELGDIVSFHANCWLSKPDDYFDVPWRSQQGGGPIFINLIHDINTMLYLMGDVASVQAMQSSSIRNHTVEDTAVILIRFHSGTLATINVSDTISAPWSWELTSGENPAFPMTSQACYLIGGTDASLSLPDLKIWRHRGQSSWTNPIDQTAIPFENNDPLISQIQQFSAVIRGDENPLVSAQDGLNTLRVIEAVKSSARSGETVNLPQSKA